ncbi:MAG: hypothetical protein AVDCRST_MAG02-831, partial [uncultured Rubrobacteraceae bacterium]
GLRCPHAGEAGRGLLQRRQGREGPRQDARARPPDAPRRPAGGGAGGRRSAGTVEGPTLLRRGAQGQEPRPRPRGRLL